MRKLFGQVFGKQSPSPKKAEAEWRQKKEPEAPPAQSEDERNGLELKVEKEAEEAVEDEERLDKEVLRNIPQLYRVNNVNLKTGAVVCSDIVLVGNIVIGENAVIHPQCVIENMSDYGEIRIGQNCIIEEDCHIMNMSDGVMEIGDFNHLRVGSTVACESMGSHNLVDVRAHLMPKSVIPSHCIIRPKCVVHSHSAIPGFTCIFGQCNEMTAVALNHREEYATNWELELKQEIEALGLILPQHHDTLVTNQSKETEQQQEHQSIHAT